MVHDYAEDLLQSMQIIATECYKDQKFDETVICTIIDDRDHKNGHYIVSDGTIKFDAYSESQDYRIDDAVRVLVIKGDYSKKKYITGKCISGEQPLTYTSATESVLDMTGNLFSTVQQLPGLIANSGNITNETLQCEDVCIWSISLSDSEFKDIQQNSIYDAIVLKADFKTMLSSYDIIKGSYGLRMDVYTSISNKKQGLYLKRFYLDSSMMFGDPYNFIIFSKQDAKFNISNNETIHTMSLYFYQNNDFIYRSNSGEYKALPASTIGENLFISDIYVGMGTDLANVEDNKFVIYTHDDLKYNLSDNDSSNQKELGLIWYNKDENNKYIGFSDGRVRNDVNGGLTINPKDENSLKYIDYDEIEYLSNQSIINRLTAQQGRYDVPDTKEGLWLAADLSELEPLLKSIKTVVYSDLFAEFNKFNIRLGALNEDTDIVNLFKTWIGDSGHFYNTETFENNVKGMIDYYKDGLEYAAAVQRNGVKNGKVSEIQIQEDGTEKEKIFTEPKGNLATYENALVGPIRGSSEQGILTFIIDQITNEELKDKNNITVAFLPRLKEILIDKYSSFLGAYDAYESRILEVIKNLQKLITEFKDLVFERQLPSGETDVSNVKKFKQLLSYTNKEQFKKYTAPDMSIYDNLYCVYWYKYQSGYIDEDDPFGRRDWQRIETDSPNIGLPTPHPEDAKNVDIKFYPAKPLDTDTHALLNLTLPVDNKEEKYKAVLIYNHEPFNSNEIVFTNERYVTDEEIKNNIKIEHGDNSQDHYPLYGIDNVLIDATAYNRPRHLRLRYCNEKGDFDDSYLANASIYWYIPLNSTMLRYDLNDLGDIKDDDSEVISKGFTNDLPITDEDGNIISNEIVDEFHRDGYAYFYKKVTATEDEDGNVKINSQDRYFTYRIKDYYNPTNTQNTIYCVIVKGQAKFETQIDLTFSTFGSNGTDYTLKISPLTSQIGVGGDSGSEEGAMPFKFKITLYDYNNEQVNITNGSDSSAAAGTAILSSVSIQGPNSVIKEYDANSDLIFEDDGTVTGSVILEKENPPCYYRVLTAFVKIKWTGPDGKELDETKQGRTVELSTYYIIPYTPHLGYYVEGPTTVVYDSQGNNPSYYKNPFKLFENTNVLSKENEELQGVESKEVPNTEWSIIYYDAMGAEVDYNSLDDESKKHYKLLMSYMPKLAGDNTLVPCNMYLSIDEPIDDQKETLYNLYPTVLCKQAGIVIWAQPIYLMQNRYPSAMLNAWDGKLQIDEENGTILSNLVGAGKKNIDNSFSGVLMGEIESKTGISIEGTNSLERSLAQNQTGMGLYGFHEGAQSFGFNINGTAFLGKSGGGRISFDGNYGFIYSGAWLNSFKKDDGTYDNPFNIDAETKNVSLNQGRAGMAIDLQDGHIDAFNFKLTSDGIQLNASPKNDENYFLIGYKDSTYLEYNAGGSLEISINNGYINANTFKLDAWHSNSGLYLNSSLESDYHLRLGNTENYITYSTNGTLTIAVKNLSIGSTSIEDYINNMLPDNMSGVEILDALVASGWTGIKKIDNQFVINATAISTGYFQVIDNNNKILFKADVANPTVELAGWDVAYNGIYKDNVGMYNRWPTGSYREIAGYRGDNWRFVAGDSFGVDRDGNLYTTSLTSLGEESAKLYISGAQIEMSYESMPGPKVAIYNQPVEDALYLELAANMGDYSEGGIMFHGLCSKDVLGGIDAYIIQFNKEEMIPNSGLYTTTASHYFKGNINFTGNINTDESMWFNNENPTDSTFTNGYFDWRTRCLVGRNVIGFGWYRDYWMPINNERASSGDCAFIAPTGDWGRVGLYGQWSVQGNLYNSTGSSIITSARLNKHSIELLDNRYINLLNYLSPVRFKYNSGTSNRYHTGLILDELKSAMDNVQLSTQELSAYCLIDQNNPDGDGGIRYIDLIPIIIAKLQKIDQQLQALK